VTARAQVELELLERGGRLQVGLIVRVAQELADCFELIVRQIVINKLAGIVGGKHFHANYKATIDVVRHVLTAQVTRKMQHAAPLP
jgi:hypothetical protein